MGNNTTIKTPHYYFRPQPATIKTKKEHTLKRSHKHLQIPSSRQALEQTPTKATTSASTNTSNTYTNTSQIHTHIHHDKLNHKHLAWDILLPNDVKCQKSPRLTNDINNNTPDTTTNTITQTRPQTPSVKAVVRLDNNSFIFRPSPPLPFPPPPPPPPRQQQQHPPPLVHPDSGTLPNLGTFSNYGRHPILDSFYSILVTIASRSGPSLNEFQTPRSLTPIIPPLAPSLPSSLPLLPHSHHPSPCSLTPIIPPLAPSLPPSLNFNSPGQDGR
ncbi:hypothetical protein Pmani_018894 [Petrolisthes manimaculis]|uniref:Uncharacterized protein n=1 Tax=Petrolisthes manimaculis TaxID=1843537 RepID=A0AAE1PLK5_9EUCA|nr:hypothetical protein Pmani_018894 [Petrolisthes manimaculis]